MIKFVKHTALFAALLMLLSAFAGCSRSHGNNADPTSLPTAPLITADPNATEDNSDPTEVPEYLWTPDPALFELGEDGYYEDEYLSAYWPSFLKFAGTSMSNTAIYTGYPEGSDKKATFSYTFDTGGSYADEVAGFDFDSYQDYLTNGMNIYFYLEEMSYVKIQGHDALKAVFNYNPPDEPEHYVRMLQYAINVNGWILGLGFSTQDETFPPEFIECIDTIRFKDGY